MGLTAKLLLSLATVSFLFSHQKVSALAISMPASTLPNKALVPAEMPAAPSADWNFTGVTTDLGIDGNGYFLLRDPETGEKFVTRYGSFYLDPQRHLVTAQGFRVQGFNAPLLFTQTFSTNLSFGDITIDKGILPTGLPSTAADADISNISIDLDGKVIVELTDGSAFIRAYIFVQQFKSPQHLSKRWLYLYDHLDQADPFNISGFSPGSNYIILNQVIEAVFPSTSPNVLMDQNGPQTSIWIFVNGGGSVLQSSDDLISWTPIFTNRTPSLSGITNIAQLHLLTGSPRFFTDSRPASSAGRFYRWMTSEIYQTGEVTDLAISGEGFFVVRNPQSGTNYVTRDGHFHLDENGFLVTQNGLRVQGNIETHFTGFYPEDAPIGDIVFDKGVLPKGLPTTATAAGITNLSIDGFGQIQILLSDGSQYVRGRILLQSFTNLFALKKEADHLYSGIDSAGPLPRLSAASGHGLGVIESGALERFSE